MISKLIYFISLYNVKQYQLMSDKIRNDRRQENRFNYSTQLNNYDQITLNLHHKYFKIYQKYSGQAQDTYSFQDCKKIVKQEDTKITSFYAEPYDKDKNIIKQLQYQNKTLKTQLKENEQIIKKLKSELQLSNNQLDKVSKNTKIDSYQYQNEVRDLREDIKIILEQNRNYESEIRKLKDIIREMNEVQMKTKYQLSQLRLFNRCKSLGKPTYQQQYSQLHCKNIYEQQIPKTNQKQLESNKKFIAGLKQMYSKVMNFNAASLKQIWRWLKNNGQMVHRLKKWRKKCRQQMKLTVNLTSEQLIDFINEAMILIN